MLVGGAGCGKTVLVNDKLNSMREETFITTIPFNHYTTSLMLQGVMEKPLEKKAGMQSVSDPQLIGLGFLYCMQNTKIFILLCDIPNQFSPIK